MNTLLRLLLVLAVIPATAKASEPAAPAPPASAGSAAVLPPCCRPVPASQPLAGNSIYQLESTWTSDRERTVPLAQFRGRPVLLVLFFSRCEFACPILVHDLKRVDAALPVGVRAGVDVVLVSIDPENDTPAALRAFRERQELPLDRWSLLRGTNDDVRELAALLGVNYRRDERGQYAHSNLITLLDREGAVAYQENGLNRPVDDLVKHLARLVAP